MKLKIRGLIFTGFAAAVFAQSASAVVPPSIAYPTESQADLTAKDNLKKTVTSQLYTDETFQERVDDPLDLEHSGNNISEKATFIPWKYGLGGENAEWTKLEGEKQISGQQEYVEIVHDNKTGTQKHYVRLNSGSIAQSAGQITAAGEGTGGEGPTAVEQGRLTTAKAVYDFVTDELDEMGANIQGNIQKHTQKVLVVTQAWATEQGYSSTMVTGTPTEGDLAHVDHWELIVPDSVVAESGSDIAGTNGTGPDQGEENDFTTAQAVYDFVHGDPNDPNSGYQPKATATGDGLSTPSAQKAQVGVRTGTGTEQDPFVSTWYGLAAGQDGLLLQSTVESTPYARVYRETRDTGGYGSGVYVDLDHARISVASTYGGTGSYEHGGIANISDYFYADGMALATAGAVKEYVDQMVGGQNIPAAPSACVQPGVHCALVTVYVAGTGTEGQEGYVAPHTTLEWTVMAGN